MKREVMMDQPYCRQQADRCRRLAHYSTDPATRVDLLRMGDEFQMMADEIENDEIIFAERKKVGEHDSSRDSQRRNAG
jgi:hypothetical protein